jgi:hypothetical protein
MSSEKKRRGPTCAADTVTFSDRAMAKIQFATDLPVFVPEDWRPFTALDNSEQQFTISASIDEDRKWRAVEDAKRKGEAPPQYDREPRQSVWPSRMSDRPGETLYRLSGYQSRVDRWILVIPGRVNRELKPEVAIDWICRINAYDLPSDLGSITTAPTDADLLRQDRDWQPGTERPSRRDDGRESQAPDRTDDPSDPAEHTVEQQAPPRESGAAPSDLHEHDRTRPPTAAADASGSRAGRQARKVPRGELDERAVAMLAGNPTLKCIQLAEALGCKPGTLYDRKKCPKLAIARAAIKAQRETYREGSTWRDRRRAADEA